MSLPMPELSEDDRLVAVDPTRPPEGSYDLSRWRHDSAKLQGIIDARAQGLSLRAVAQAYRVSARTVAAIEERHCPDIAARKKDMAGKARTFSRLALDRLVDEVDDIPVGQLPVAAAILIDKMQLLDGEPTSISARGAVSPEDARAALNEMIDALPRANVVEGELIEDDPDEPVRPGGEGAPKGAADPDDGEDPEDPAGAEVD